MTRIVCLECVIKADRNQSWGQDLKCPVLCNWHPNETTMQMDESEVKYQHGWGTWVHREGETGPKSHMESGMWGRIHYLPRSKQCPAFTKLCMSWDIRL